MLRVSSYAYILQLFTDDGDISITVKISLLINVYLIINVLEQDVLQYTINQSNTWLYFHFSQRKKTQDNTYV